MTTQQNDYHDDQFFRRFFDALYQFDIRAVIDTWNNIPRRTRRMLMISFATMVLVWVSIQFISNVTSMVAEANMPTLEERLNAPYELNARLLPTLGVTQFLAPAQAGYTSTSVDASLVNPAYSCMINGTGDVCSGDTFFPFTTYNEAWQFVDPNMATFAEQIATYEAELEAYQTALADAQALAVEQAMTEALAGQPEGTIINPEDLVIPEVVIDMAEPVMPELTLLPEIRVVMTQFDSEATTHTAIQSLVAVSRQAGTVGNYVLVNDVPVNYFYSADDGWQSFTWAHGTWIFTVSSTSYTAMESVVTSFPY